MLPVEQVNHLPFGYNENGARGHRSRRGEAYRLAGPRPFTDEVAGAQYPYDRLFDGLGDDRQLHAPVLNVEDGIGRVAPVKMAAAGGYSTTFFAIPGELRKGSASNDLLFCGPVGPFTFSRLRVRTGPERELAVL
jgi:hypothetical protein